MAAPDRAYRYFTNLISKTTDGNSQVKHYIRCAKPLSAYISQSSVTSQEQIAEFCAKFKVDGILWVKNPDVPKQANDDPNTVTIIDPNDPNEEDTLTIIDPDLSDSNRDGIIAYVYPNGQNAIYHDIRTTINGGNSQYTDFSNRSWSRASKFRYKKYGDSEEAIILNDAGLNRRGYGEIQENGIDKYIYSESLGEKPRFNDIQVISDFYGTPYNKLYTTSLEVKPVIASDFSTPYTQVANFGFIGRMGPTMNPNVPYTIKFVGRKKENDLNSTPVCKINWPNNSNFPKITINGNNVLDEGFSVNIPQYSFRLKVTNEEGTIYSDSVDEIDVGLYRWNKDDDEDYGVKLNNSDTDRISLSHFNSDAGIEYFHQEPETSVSRYNLRMGATTNQIDKGEPYIETGGLIDPAPNDSKPVLLFYSKSGNFTYERNPFGATGNGVTMDNMEFFINESDSNGKVVYYPFIPGKYNFKTTGNMPVASYLTMRCAINDIENVYCIEYMMDSGLKPAISRVWELEYNGTIWYWPKSENNKNFKITAVNYAVPSQSQGLGNPPTDLLETNTIYGISLHITGFSEGETITRIEIKNYKTQNAFPAKLVDSSGTEIGTVSPNYETYQDNSTHTSAGGITTLKDICYIKRIDSTVSTQSRVEITVYYQTYQGMWYGDNGTTVNKVIEKKTIGYRNNIKGILYFNYKSKYTTYSDGDHANPNAIYADALVSEHSPAALNQGNDVLFYIGSGTDSTNGVLYTDETTTSSIATGANLGQGYYFNNYSPSENTSNGIYYVDASGYVSKVVGS